MKQFFAKGNHEQQSGNNSINIQAGRDVLFFLPEGFQIIEQISKCVVDENTNEKTFFRLRMAGLAALQEGRFLQAIYLFETYLNKNPDSAIAHYNVGTAKLQFSLQLKDRKIVEQLRAEALVSFEEAERLGCDDAMFLNDFGKMMQTMGMAIKNEYVSDKFLAMAENFYHAAMKKDNKAYAPIYNLAVFLALKASSMVQKDRKEEALTTWEAADSWYEAASRRRQKHGALWFSWELMLYEWKAYVSDKQRQELEQRITELHAKGIYYAPEYYTTWNPD